MQLKDLLIKPEKEDFQLLAVVESNQENKVVVLQTAHTPEDLQKNFMNYLHDEDSLSADIQYSLMPIK
ncbi:hypothetical protein ICK_06133 [Bacillus cereus BAG1X2-2]|nr:hypothetical protein ICK_06133 [Bacillus cereus BAG1X2-2]